MSAVEEHRAELRRFLKERRARISPAEAGLPAGTRRRVPGLRREEVATLAGIGVSWYTEFENGDARNVSDATLHAVGDALRLSTSEREYLAALMGRAAGPRFETPNPLVVAMMNALTIPAYIITAAWEVIDANIAFRHIWNISGDELPFNAIERLFMHPSARPMHGDEFVTNIRPVIAMLRSSQGRYPDIESLRRVRDRIITEDALRAIWNEYEISSPVLPNTCRIQTPAGPFCYQTLTLPVTGYSYGIVAQIPDAESLDRLATARGR